MRRRVYATGTCTLKPDAKARELQRQDAIVTLLGWLSEQPEVVARAEAAGIIAPANSTPELWKGGE